MKKFRMKLQQFKKTFYGLGKKIKLVFWKVVLNYEKKRKMSTRCQFCKENVFCENYDQFSKDTIFNPQRCSNKHSTR